MPRWPSVYNAWLVFAKFSSVTDPIEGYVGAIDAAVRGLCVYEVDNAQGGAIQQPIDISGITR